MNDPDFTADERQVLGALLFPPPNAPVSQRTTAHVVQLTQLPEARVVSALENLAAMTPPAVRRLVDATTQDEFWIVLVLGADALEAERE